MSSVHLLLLLLNTVVQLAAAATASSFSMTSLGIPLTDSMSAGFTIGFMKG
jgi:hypothetical protein